MSLFSSTPTPEDTNPPPSNATLLTSSTSTAQPQAHLCYYYHQHYSHAPHILPLRHPGSLEQRDVGDGSLQLPREAAAPGRSVASPIAPSPPQRLLRVHQPVVYAPWDMMPQPTDGAPAHQLHAIPGAPVGPTPATVIAQGAPAISLDLPVPPSPDKQVRTYYALVLFVLMAAMGLLLGSFFTPICTACLNFTRSVTDVQDPAVYKRSIEGSRGMQISAYAAFSPCTVFKRHACDTITADQVSGWMRSITNGMQAPFPDLFSYSGIDRARVSSCSYIRLPAATTHPVPQLQNTAAPRLWPNASCFASPHASRLEKRRQWPGQRLDKAMLLATTILRTHAPLLARRMAAMRATFGAKAAFTLTCDSDTDTVPMLNLTTIYNADVSAYLSDGTNASSSKMVSAADLITRADPKNVVREYQPVMRTCAEYLAACATIEPGYYVVIAPASPLHRCGQEAISPPSSPSRSSATAAKVLICGITVYEPTAYAAGAMRFIARAHLAMNMVVYPSNVRFPSSAAGAPVCLTPSAILLVFAEAFMLLTIVLTAVTVGMAPVQRAKLRQLRAALDVDASVAMEILYRAQGAVAAGMPLTAAPAPAAPRAPHEPGAEAGHATDEPAAATADDASPMSFTSASTAPPRPHMQTSQQQPSEAHTPQSELSGTAAAMLLVPPYYQPGGMTVPGASGSGSMGVPGIMAGLHPSPYSEGYYLEPEHGPRNAAAPRRDAADGVVPPAGAAHTLPAAAAARHGERDRSTTTRGVSYTASPGTSLVAQERSVVCSSSGVRDVSAHAADAVSPPALMSLEHPEPLMPVSEATGWMFGRSRHIASQSMLEESSSSARTAEERNAAGASMPGNWPGSDTESRLGSDDRLPLASYVLPENSPGERTIQLFLLRARKSYTRLRRKQVRVLAKLLFYAKAAAFTALVFALVCTGLQLSGVSARGREGLQFRGGDTLSDDYVLNASHVALMSLSLACVVVVVVLDFVVERKRLW
ncbi:putative integral membrane protein [Leishmania donovani]|uniref:Putative integral membrane protein n=1 Tax=Leishmania donovani TaxID=5661 RepID=A0A504WXM5_LEIDO|nr:putative integral membrane protein [Leishmania donovani]